MTMAKPLEFCGVHNRVYTAKRCPACRATWDDCPKCGRPDDTEDCERDDCGLMRRDGETGSKEQK